VRQISGISPVNIQLYHLAARHRSMARQNEQGFRESNERLEYLGDAVLGMAVAEYLFAKFPMRDEGFLTEIRSRIVNRDILNEVARKMGIAGIVEYSGSPHNRLSYKSIYGDTLEALIGAMYLDHGYGTTRKFIIKKLLRQHFDLREIISTNPNHKSRVIEWAHRNNKSLGFHITEQRGSGHHREFLAELRIGGETIARGNGFSKKKAEQDAAKKACEKLNIE
jgi:ribonuclease III